MVRSSAPPLAAASNAMLPPAETPPEPMVRGEWAVMVTTPPEDIADEPVVTAPTLLRVISPLVVSPAVAFTVSMLSPLLFVKLIVPVFPANVVTALSALVRLYIPQLQELIL